MQMFIELSTVYLHRDPVDFRNYAECLIMRSKAGTRLLTK